MQLEKLALQIAKRDKNSFEQLYNEISRVVYSVCFGITRNRAVAQELTQDTFVAVWENVSAYKGNGFKTWIMTIARNKSLNSLRNGKREVTVDFTENENLGGGYTFEEQAETRSELDAALSVLNDDERQIVLMRTAGLKASEISDLLDMPRGTVSWKYSEGICKMKNYLEGSNEKVRRKKTT